MKEGIFVLPLYAPYLLNMVASSRARVQDNWGRGAKAEESEPNKAPDGGASRKIGPEQRKVLPAFLDLLCSGRNIKRLF